MQKVKKNPLKCYRERKTFKTTPERRTV